MAAVLGARIIQGESSVEIVAGTNKAQIHWASPRVLCIDWHHRGDAEIVRGVNRALATIKQPESAFYCLCDTSFVTHGYDVQLSAPAREMFGRLRQNGMIEMVVVAKSAAIRMLAYTFSLGMGLPVKVFETRTEAVAYCQTAA